MKQNKYPIKTRGLGQSPKPAGEVQNAQDPKDLSYKEGGEGDSSPSNKDKRIMAIKNAIRTYYSQNKPSREGAAMPKALPPEAQQERPKRAQIGSSWIQTALIFP